jgi:hypothetical protein
MKTGKEHSHWPFFDIVVVVLAWIIAIALAYTVLVKFRLIIKH